MIHKTVIHGKSFKKVIHCKYHYPLQNKNKSQVIKLSIWFIGSLHFEIEKESPSWVFFWVGFVLVFESNQKDRVIFYLVFRFHFI